MITERTPSEKLPPEKISESIALLSGWSYSENCISKEYAFRNFRQAINFINAVADLAETHDHHPDLLLSKYKFVTVIFSTHSAGGVTENDLEMAGLVEAIKK